MMPTGNGGISQIDELMLKLDALPDPAARAVAVELVQAVMNLHAAALERLVDIVAASAPEVMEALGTDGLVSRMLVLHGIHPDDFDTRFARAIGELQSFFRFSRRGNTSPRSRSRANPGAIQRQPARLRSGGPKSH
jgi:hypothetical protein